MVSVRKDTRSAASTTRTSMSLAVLSVANNSKVRQAIGSSGLICVKKPPVRSVAIFMKVRRALERGGATRQQVDVFMTEVKSGDYDNVLATCMRWADVS